MDDPLPKPRELTPQLRRRVFLFHGSVWWLWVPATGWILWAVYVFLHFDLAGAMHGHGEIPFGEDKSFELMLFAIGISAVGFVVGIVRIRQALRLARYGVETVATILNVWKFSFHGMARVDFQYSYGSQVIEKAISVDHDRAKRYRDGTEQLVILVDPAKPTRWMEKALVLPKKSTGSRTDSA